MTDRRPPELLREGRDNQASRGASVSRLNGQVYTPPALAAEVVAGLPLADGDRWVDPAAGDGVFLEAVWRRCAAEGRRGVVLEGWDLDAAALAAARARMDALSRTLPADVTVRLVHRDGLDAAGDGADVVVGNPPYLEAKRMPDALKTWIKRAFPLAAFGAFDLYAAFVERATRLVREGGTVAFVVPNRLLVTSAAEALRAALVETGRVRVQDRSEAADFAAGVYPIVLHWTRGASSALEVGGVVLTPDVLAGRGGVWPSPTAGEGARLLARLLADPGLEVLGDAFDIRWTVSFHRAGLRDRFVADARPDGPHARRFLGGRRFAGNREVQPYRLTWAGTWIDYDEARARVEDHPLPEVGLFRPPKVAVCQNARRARAALDRADHVFKDTFLAVRHPDDDEAALAWLVLVLHSDVFHAVYAQLFGGTRKRGGYLGFLKRYLGVMPCPRCPDPAAALRLHDALAGGADRQAEAEAWVRRAYGVTPSEEAWLDATTFPPW